MAEVPSTFRLTPGAQAPAFSLSDSSGAIHSPASLAADRRGLLIFFACNHCPYVIHLAAFLGRFTKRIAEEGIATAAICSNDAERYPADAPEKMIEFAQENAWDFPYLFDATQEVALAYSAACTPDFYLFDSTLRLCYAGQFDTSRPGRGIPSGKDLDQAIDDLLAGRATPEPWYPSSGCNIKWKPGNEPDYFTSIVR